FQHECGEVDLHEREADLVACQPEAALGVLHDLERSHPTRRLRVTEGEALAVARRLDAPGLDDEPLAVADRDDDLLRGRRDAIRCGIEHEVPAVDLDVRDADVLLETDRADGGANTEGTVEDRGGVLSPAGTCKQDDHGGEQRRAKPHVVYSTHHPPTAASRFPPPVALKSCSPRPMSPLPSRVRSTSTLPDWGGSVTSRITAVTTRRVAL